ncbi:MAG: polysaccharide biosynthesis C-terminal domain-containing protein [Lachnospiraceae bacterium]|nr:polysaccharide biosynthesis C-terminal domain-containing protein [Lachnospiraceae bacterium]
MSKGRYGYLFSNMALFTVSNFVSKLLVFLLVPFYTSVLSEAEYGVADVMQTTLLLTVPLLSINIGEAALRFALSGEDRKSILKTGLKYVTRAVSLVFALGVAVIGVGNAGVFALINERLHTQAPLATYIAVFIVLFAADSVYEFMLLYCQGCDRTKIMITGSISCTALVIASNLCLLLIFRLGLYGYLAAQIISFFGAALIMFILVKGADALRSAEENEELERTMCDYGRNMQLYAASSWANNAIDRYFILIMLGSAANGLYGVAYKIPAILTTFQRIFAQAFQMSAVKEYQGADRAEFFSGLFKKYNALMVVLCAWLIYFLKLIAAFLFRKGFFEAWVLVPPLLVSVIFGALEGYLGSICLAFKDGKSMGRATGTGALVNIVLNFVLISWLGALGAAVATLISYFVMFVLAYVYASSHVRLSVGFGMNILCYALLLIESACVMGGLPGWQIWNAVIALILTGIYLRELMPVAKRLVERINGKRMIRNDAE